MSYLTSADNFDLITNGNYECKIEKVEEKITTTNKKYLNLYIRIRNDIEQKFRNRVVFKTLWEETEGENKGKYDPRGIFFIVKAITNQDVLDSVLATLNTTKDIIDYISNKNVQCNIITRTYQTLNGDTKKENAIKMFLPTSTTAKVLPTPTIKVQVDNADIDTNSEKTDDGYDLPF